jgi:hypothetical protein
MMLVLRFECVPEIMMHSARFMTVTPLQFSDWPNRWCVIARQRRISSMTYSPDFGRIRMHLSLGEGIS